MRSFVVVAGAVAIVVGAVVGVEDVGNVGDDFVVVVVVTTFVVGIVVVVVVIVVVVVHESAQPQ